MKKLAQLVLALAMIMSIFTGCQTSSENSSQSAYVENSQSQIVNSEVEDSSEVSQPEVEILPEPTPEPEEPEKDINFEVAEEDALIEINGLTVVDDASDPFDYMKEQALINYKGMHEATGVCIGYKSEHYLPLTFTKVLSDEEKSEIAHLLDEGTDSSWSKTTQVSDNRTYEVYTGTYYSSYAGGNLTGCAIFYDTHEYTVFLSDFDVENGIALLNKLIF